MKGTASANYRSTIRRLSSENTRLQTALTTEREARLRAESERDAARNALSSDDPVTRYMALGPLRSETSKAAPATDEDVERGTEAMANVTDWEGVRLGDKLSPFELTEAFKAAIEALRG